MAQNNVDNRTWEMLMDRFDSLDKKVDCGFSKINGRVRFTEKMLWTAFGGIGVVGFVLAMIARAIKF